jgi:hypothetical protein
MRPHCKFIATVFLMLCILAVADVARAQVSVYSDAWSATEANDDSTVTLYGYGDIDDGGAGGRLGIAAVIYDPNWSQLAVQGASGFDFVSAQTSYNLPEWCLTGIYHIEGSGDYQFSHYDCSFTPMEFGSTNADYWKSSEWPMDNIQWARYVRCQEGVCNQVEIKKSHMGGVWNWPGGSFPPFARIHSLWSIVPYTDPPVRVCVATSRIKIDGC